jgi:anti-sigma B factor antagonist
MDAEGKPRPPPGGPEVSSATELNFSVRRVRDAHVVTLRGAARLEGAEELFTQLPLLVQPACPHLIIDLSGLNFLTSIGIGAIVAAHNQARDLNGHVSIVNPKPDVAGVLRLTRVDRLVPIFPTLESAQQALSDTQARGA